jgi:hypothetical protein
MGCEVGGSAVTPGPWRPHTPLSAEQPAGTTQLVATITASSTTDTSGVQGDLTAPALQGAQADGNAFRHLHSCGTGRHGTIKDLRGDPPITV